MKPFQLITETDARVLTYGSTVTLAKGGHITPLALDTLRERRITVVREGVDVDAETLAPPATVRIVAIGGDHTSLALKKAIVEHLRGRGLAAHDLGTHDEAPVDYPDTAAAVARQVARGEAQAGIAIDGSGMGSAVAANKVDGIQSAMCQTDVLARYARQHNGANVLTLGSSLVTAPDALDIVDAFLGTPMRDPRYMRRLAKIRDLEQRRVR